MCHFFVFKEDLEIISSVYFACRRLNILVLGGNAGLLELYAYGMYKIASLTDVRHLCALASTLYLPESLVIDTLYLIALCRS